MWQADTGTRKKATLHISRNFPVEITLHTPVRNEFHIMKSHLNQHWVREVYEKNVPDVVGFEGGKSLSVGGGGVLLAIALR